MKENGLSKPSLLAPERTTFATVAQWLRQPYSQPHGSKSSSVHEYDVCTRGCA